MDISLWQVIEVVGGILVSLVMRNFTSTIRDVLKDLRIAILELKEELHKEYATKIELADVKETVALAKRVDAGFETVLARLPIRAATIAPPGVRQG